MSGIIPNFVNPLEELLAESLISQTPKKVRRVRNAALDAQEVSKLDSRLRDSLGDRPENWTARRRIALIHRESNALLGNFTEFTHNRLHTEAHPCRKLMRQEEPSVVDCAEWVSGPQWIAWKADLPGAERWQEVREAILDLHLHELGVRAAGVQVDVTILHGAAVARVELSEATHFHSEDGRTAFFLPKHLNVLDGLSIDCKLALRAELELDKPAVEPEEDTDASS